MISACPMGAAPPVAHTYARNHVMARCGLRCARITSSCEWATQGQNPEWLLMPMRASKRILYAAAAVVRSSFKVARSFHPAFFVPNRVERLICANLLVHLCKLHEMANFRLQLLHFKVGEQFLQSLPLLLADISFVFWDFPSKVLRVPPFEDPPFQNRRSLCHYTCYLLPLDK